MATFEQSIEHAILAAITTRISEMVEEEEAKAIDRVRRRIRAEVAGVSAAVFKNVSFERLGTDLCIRIQDKREAV